MRNPQEILENLNKQAIKHKDNADYKFNELYKHLLNPLMYKHSYAQIYANRGSGTAGVDGETADGFGDDTIQKIIDVMKDEKYQPKPTRRTYIDKKNNRGKRPLGIPAMTDRYVQEIVNELLTIIYEPLFSNKSFGFRQGLSCHDAVHAIQITFQGTVWFIEGDIKGFFDNIDHHIMIEILKKKINDERFIRLIWKFLSVGYLEEWTFYNTYSGIL
jgi:retron-type reverse transcriptase